MIVWRSGKYGITSIRLLVVIVIVVVLAAFAYDKIEHQGEARYEEKKFQGLLASARDLRSQEQFDEVVVKLQEALKIAKESASKADEKRRMKELKVVFDAFKAAMEEKEKKEEEARKEAARKEKEIAKKEEKRRQEERQALWEKAKKPHPDREASEIVLAYMADEVVRDMINKGQLISGTRLFVDFQRVKGKENVDANCYVGYEFVFWTQGGVQRRNIGSIFFYHDPRKEDWIIPSPLGIDIDGVPKF